MSKAVIHLISCFHGFLADDWSHCAFSQKCRKMSAMMEPLGYTIYEYANSPSESVCSNKVPMLSRDEMDRLTGGSESKFHGDTAKIGSPWWTEFDARLRRTLAERVSKGDLILHPFGRSHAALKNDFPDQIHVESGIGYGDAPFGAYRIFESYAWMAWHQGKQGVGHGSDYEWVVPNSFFVKDWTPVYYPGEYSIFMGRIYDGKGMQIVRALAEAGQKILVAGQGDFTPYAHPNLTYLGPIIGRERDKLLGNAKCMLMPTRFIEPFGGSGVEAMLTGTPLISSDWGAFAETVEHGKTGFRCHTLADWIEAIRLAPTLDRRYIADRARRLYSLETCGAQYHRIFTQLSDLWADGWYAKRPLFVP